MLRPVLVRSVIDSTICTWDLKTDSVFTRLRLNKHYLHLSHGVYYDYISLFRARRRYSLFYVPGIKNDPKIFCLVFCAYITNSSLNSLPNEYISSLDIQIPQIIYQFYIFFFWWHPSWRFLSSAMDWTVPPPPEFILKP